MVPSILGMTGALAGQGRAVTILTPTPSRLDDLAVPDQIAIRGPEADLEAAVRSAEIVHLHGLWQGHTRRGARTAREARVPYLIAAHGMAEPWALRQKALKKKLYTALIEGKNLRRASCLHALSRPEIDHLRALAPRTPIALVPNGVNLASLEDLPDREVLEAQYPRLEGKFVLLFLGRLHVKKGLDLLAAALGSIVLEYPDVHLILAGNDDGARTPFLERMRDQGLLGHVTDVGHVSDERALQVWGAADAFVLPSYSEGFSMAILEALACRLPVVVTTACHFPELTAAEGGIVVPPTIDGVTCGLRDLLNRSPADRRKLGQHGRELVEQRYTWDQQAARLAEVYRWILGGGPAPEVIVSPPSRRQGRVFEAHHLFRPSTRESEDVVGLEDTTHLMIRTIAPVSVLVPVKNEAGNLRRCLPALAWADEVFVVDSQSTDATVAVAEQYGAQVVQFHFNGVYPKKKNWALENLPFRNPWVLIVDADEVVVPELAEEIVRRTETHEADGYELNMKYFFLGRRIRHCGYAEAWNLRLFRHRLGRYERMPSSLGAQTGDNEAHEHVELRGRVLRLVHELDHYAYPSISTWVEKHDRYASWEADQYERFLHEPVPASIGAAKRLKRRLKKVYLHLPLRPLLRFVYAYIVRLGFLDGMPGLVFCTLLAFYDFLAWAKVYEKRLGGS
jgi:glycosyltransferase involved in cell wall biosynthesis